MNKCIIAAFISCLVSSHSNSQVTNKASHPVWCEQSNIYEVNLRQYSQAGTIKEFEKHLPRLRRMGVEILWFMPINPIGIEGRKMSSSDLGSYYAVRNYKEVSDEIGTMGDWKAMVKHAHSMGFKVIIDWVPNHSSPDNPWIKSHPNFYEKDKHGTIIPPNPDWTDTRKLDYSSNELRDTMTEAMKFWIRETGIDGFRCDVASGPPADFWKKCISTLKKVKNIFMLAEGESPELHNAGFDATYAWSVMGPMSDVYNSKRSLASFDSILQHYIAVFPKDAIRMYFTSDHDENSWNGSEFEKYGDAYKVFGVFSQTWYQSVPLIYSGQEVKNTRRLKFFVKDPIVWGDYSMAPFYTTLLKLRRRNLALSADASCKRIITANDMAIFAFMREKAGHKVLVVLNLSGHPQRFTIKDKTIAGETSNVFTNSKQKLGAQHVFSLAAWGYEVYEFLKG